MRGNKRPTPATAAVDARAGQGAPLVSVCHLGGDEEGSHLRYDVTGFFICFVKEKKLG
jgi:hypothetical protein